MTKETPKLTKDILALDKAELITLANSLISAIESGMIACASESALKIHNKAESLYQQLYNEGATEHDLRSDKGLDTFMKMFQSL